jgi:hypothetical protein
MGRELRIIGFVVLAAIAFSFLAGYNKQPAKPIPMPPGSTRAPNRAALGINSRSNGNRFGVSSVPRTV